MVKITKTTKEIIDFIEFLLIEYPKEYNIPNTPRKAISELLESIGYPKGKKPKQLKYIY